MLKYSSEQVTNGNCCVNNLQYYGAAENFEHGTRGRALIPFFCFSITLQCDVFLALQTVSKALAWQESSLTIGKKHGFEGQYITLLT